MPSTDHTRVTIPQPMLSELVGRYGLFNRTSGEAARALREAMDLTQIARALELEDLAHKAWARFSNYAKGVGDTVGIHHDLISAAVRQRVIAGGAA